MSKRIDTPGSLSHGTDFQSQQYIDTSFGGPNHRNNVIHLDSLTIPPDVSDCFTTMYRFRKDYLILCQETGSVRGANKLSCWSDYMWFDIDSDDLTIALVNSRQLLINIEKIDCALSNWLVIYFSGHKGYHIGIPSVLFGFEPSVDLPRIQKLLAKEIAGDVPIDTAIYEHNRLWRIPNTRHGKSGLYKTKLTYEQLATRNVDQITDLARKPGGPPAICFSDPSISQPNQKLVELRDRVIREQAGRSRLRPKGDTEGVAGILANLCEGNRNASFARITGRLRRQGWEAEDILSLVLPHAEACDFPIEELRREVEGICQRYAPAVSVSRFPYIYTGKSENGKFEVQPLADFMAAGDTEINWRVEGLFPAEGVAIVAGPAGYGKSWMLIDLAVECARGGDWLGQFPAKQGRVLYIDEESQPNLLRHRFKKVLAAKGLQDNQLDIHLAVMPGLCLNDDNSVECLRSHLQSIQPDVVVVDCLIRVHRAEENSAKEMSRIFSRIKGLVREGHCLFIFVDHQRKPGQHKVSQDVLLRGTSDKAAFVDTLMSLQRKDDRLIVEHSKSRFAEPVAAFVVAIEDPSPGCTSVAYKGDAETIRKQEHLVGVGDFIKRSIPEEDWISRQNLVDEAKKEGISPRVLSETLKGLVEQGVLARADRKPEQGRGGKAAFYRRLTPFPISPIYIEEKRKTEKPQDGAS